MDTLSKRESLPAVTAAGVVAIIFSALGGLLGLLVEVSMLLAPGLQTSDGAPGMPPGTRTIVEVFWLFGLAVAVFGLFAGIGVLRRGVNAHVRDFQIARLFHNVGIGDEIRRFLRQ